jgi:hypothetical protein
VLIDIALPETVLTSVLSGLSVVELFVDTVGIFVVTLSVVELFVDTVGIFVVTLSVVELLIL